MLARVADERKIAAPVKDGDATSTGYLNYLPT